MSKAQNAAGSAAAFISGTTSSSSTSTTSASTSVANFNQLVIAHAAMLGGSYVLLFPLGVVLLHFLGVRYHYLWQLLTTIVCFAGLAVAVVMSRNSGAWTSLRNPHQILGIVSVALLVPQAVLGLVHHLLFKRTKQKGWSGRLHLGLGRVALVLGLVNGVL